MNTQQLRQKILDLAIRGQLVSQDSKDEPASVLLEKIRAEKQQLIEQKKIKKDKKSSYITCEKSPYRKYTEHFADGTTKDITEEIPFDIPENWAWCRLGEIGVSELGKTLNSNKDRGELTPYLCSINIHWTHINLEEVKKAKFTKEEKEKYTLSKNDLLICEGGDVGRCFVWNLPIPMYYQNALHRVRFYNEINSYFFKFVIEYYKNIHILGKYSKGVTIKHFTKTALHSICFPLPPLSEQKRIVAKVEELLALVEDLETNKTDLKSTIQQAKAKVLDMAIRGELVPQNPDDEPASVLLERIRNEQQSAKSKKKNTVHNTHYEEEAPFEIPENWVWCRLGEIGEVIMGQSPKSENISGKGNLEFHQGKIFFTSKYIKPSNFYTNEITKVAPANSVLICVRAPVGEVNITNRRLCIGRGLCCIVPLQRMSEKFIYYWTKTLKRKFIQKATGSTFSSISMDVIKNEIVPLPPLSEQKRIVQKIEEIFTELDTIEENLT
ncbi:restriction endonuclease subunit S [Capnocytophaga canimorsus]|uniref:restriction endonuclease subunit S n=1 Tax=Capnocytophaga canimorsus TaxID=28188 RepID=UPI0037D217D6